MKKIINISLCAALLAFGACNKKLDQSPVSSVTTGNYYANANDFLSGVNSVYSNLNAYPDYQLWMGEMRSDNISATSDGNRDWQGINNFSPNLTTTAFIVGAYNNDFNGIYNANTVLNAIAAKGANIGDTSLRNRFTAECRFLRALYYFDLLRFYGKLPIVDSATTYTEALNIGRSPVADVYNLIIGDLNYAVSKLPATYTGTNVGRATVGAAKTLLGLVYLTRSGPTYSGVEGPTLASGEYDKALALFNEVIGSGTYSFLPSYPNIFSYTNENNKEVIFDVQYVSGYSTSSTTYGGDFPSMLVPPAYFTGLGLSGYGNGYGTCTFNIPYDLTASYKASGVTDTRDTFNIQRQFKAATTDVVFDTTRPFIKKYINISKIGARYTDWPINFVVMRYTDVLMMKAECILHGAAGTQATVDSIVNAVRARAGITTPLSNVTLAQLMEERRREFLGEGLRWNDLVREGMAVTTMNAWRTSQGLTGSINEVVPNYVIYPIPQAEILVKSGLYTQNPGYN
ncbi:Starch-binding associating with outer membrane [Filimonas lacunae]|uniref:Starch-binding associating with outer membrane n=1 Tax=Filimonas lacunae TaxID=477680 RepID=A0A173MP64_9BACT|nr:RagB/SusD family nutrient uptake outer membrane protein [Filimonas lacunae]BAV09276.1 outer membrane protein, nutrient binding [Filimonas lacunae]SIS70299.1 Starch-binding associating with outer membrane [Filimonas lacunae]